MFPAKMSWRALVALAVSVCALPHNDEQSRVIKRKFIHIIESAGYPVEVHDVTTEDGYILGVHRIPHGRSGPCEGRRPVVFLMHGLMSASSHFVSLGDSSIAFNLADAGYDVWMGNARGNSYSRAHVSMDPDHSEQKLNFFDFSWEDIALIDIPAMVDYALAQTGEERLHYIGHSQGGTVFLVLNSMNPEYNAKFASAHLLAGVGYMANFPNRLLGSIAQMTRPIYSVAVRMGLVEISLNALPISLPDGAKPSDFCFGDIQYKDLCELIGLDAILSERNVTNLEMSGASIKQIAHFGQNVKDGAFRRWDHGLIRNRIVYGCITPPSYNLSRVTVDTTMHYSLGDVLLHERDVLDMAAIMPNTVARKIARDSFLHVDYISSPDVKELLTDYIIQRLNETELLYVG